MAFYKIIREVIYTEEIFLEAENEEKALEDSNGYEGAKIRDDSVWDVKCQEITQEQYDKES